MSVICGVCDRELGPQYKFDETEEYEFYRCPCGATITYGKTAEKVVAKSRFNPTKQKRKSEEVSEEVPEEPIVAEEPEE
jgi:DNA-directed RNA polymerase subunit RPC12/RpoP